MSPQAYLLIGIAIGALAGFAIGWLLRSRKSVATPVETPTDTGLIDELKRQSDRATSETENLREKLSHADKALATAEANRGAAEKLLAEQKEIHTRALAEARSAQEAALASLKDAFKGLSAEALQKSHPEFIRQANETFAKFQETAKGDLTQRQQEIAKLLEPLKQQLDTYQRKLSQSETNQNTALTELKKQFENLSAQSQSLSSETLQLRQVLSSSQARGRWGEETLRRVVEAAGMSQHCDFTEQTQSGDSKPDMIVRLPGDRYIIVDAKAPDLDFLNALEESDPANRAVELGKHARKLKETIKSLADRDYPKQFPDSLDYVVMFLPAESLFSAALEGDRDLIVWAAEKRILLATPTSLIALLRSVSVSWQQHDQTVNARAIADAAKELFDRVAKFTEHFENIRKGLERANLAYNDAVGSYERMVRPSGERLAKLGGTAAGKELTDARHLEATLRLPPDSNDPTDSTS
ncbi:MAG: DNA recombination protein RmuC [Limisphaerales bacterium]|jgi:DNA recombination protein RmuC